MKKNKLLVILSLALTLSCLLSALSMNAFAGILQHDHYVTNQQYTKLTNTYGYSSASFTGNYYEDEPSRNNAILASEVYGGPRSNFVTTLDTRFWGGGSVTTNSDDEGSRSLSATLVSTTCRSGDHGYSHQTCTSKSDPDDNWTYGYSAAWGGFPYGWCELQQGPNNS